MFTHVPVTFILLVLVVLLTMVCFWLILERHALIRHGARWRIQAQLAENALHKLLYDVTASIDYGMPFANPEHGFHDSVSEACEVLKLDIAEIDR